MTLTSRLLSYLCDDMLQVGAEWSIRTDDSCTWWPHDLAQHITTRPITTRPITNQGEDDGVLLIVETNLLVGVPLDHPETGVRLNTLNADNALSTLALGEDGVLRLRFSMRVFDDTFGWTSRWAARLCACQVADALILAAEAAVLYPRAQRASSEHPVSGRRGDVDDVVTVRQATIDRSRELWASLSEVDLATGLNALGGPQSQVIATVGTHTTQPWVLPPSDSGRWEGHGDLRTVADLTVHNRYGPSVVVMTWPPYAIGPDRSAGLAAILNDATREERSTAGAIGTWLADGTASGVAVRTIIPAAMSFADDQNGLAALVTNVARYHARQCSKLAVVTSGLLTEQDGADPFVTDTVPAEMVSPERFGRAVPDEAQPGADQSPARPAHPRRLPDGMIESYVETLVERLTGTEKAQSDADGDYPIRFRNALYYVRVVHAADPVVQFFSIAVSDVPLTKKLALDLNEINSRIRFCRAFWVDGQVLFESEHLALSLDQDDFGACTDAVARATNEHAEALARHHGGRRAFEEAKDPEYTPPDEQLTGLYL